MNKKLLFQSILSVVVTVIAIIIFSPNTALATTSPTPTTDPLTTQLIGLAQSKLDAEYNVLLSGDSTKLTKANLAISGAVEQKMSDVATTQLGRYNILAEHGLHYTKFSSKLTPQNIAVSNGSATLTADEYTVLHLDNGTKNPVDTKTWNTHIFHFTLNGNQWSLDKDEDAHPYIPTSQVPEKFKIKGKPMLRIDKSNPPVSRNGESVQFFVLDNQTRISRTV